MSTQPDKNSPADGRKGTILIVDDHPVNIRLLEKILDAGGYRTLAAENGPEGRKLAASRLPDLILLDIMMPKMSGFEVCKQLKSNPETRDIPIVMVTALSETADIERATECGTDDYLTKPIERAALVNLVRAMLQNRVRK